MTEQNNITQFPCGDTKATDEAAEKAKADAEIKRQQSQLQEALEIGQFVQRSGLRDFILVMSNIGQLLAASQAAIQNLDDRLKKLEGEKQCLDQTTDSQTTT